MNFEMDQQSQDDLSIFGKESGAFSVFGLYSRTRTVGGRNRMDEMMRNPSNKLKTLCERRDAIQFFIESKTQVKINHASFDLILHYLQHGGVFMRSNLIDSFSVYVKSKISPNQEYYNIQVGLKHLLPLLEHGEEISENLISANAESLNKLGIAIKEITEKPNLKYAISLAKLKKLDFYQLAKVDHIIRRVNLQEINDLFKAFYELDVFETLARITTEYKFCLPSYFDDERPMKIEIEELIHPALQQPVPSDVSISEGNNLMFLSGSNMSGKSSLLKSIGLAVYLSHLGFPVPAKKMTTTVFNGLVTTINLPDNVQNGLSHYYTEVIRVKKIATLLTQRKKMFILLDELFKGTNTKDAFDASLLVLNGFAEIKSSIFIVSSHITELAPMLLHQNVCLKYLEHLIVDEIPKFTYHLKEGVAVDGIGMYFIQNEHIEDILNQAKLI